MTVCALAAQDARTIIERSVLQDQRDDELAVQYSYLENESEQEWKNGQRTKLETKTYEVQSLYGQPYRRLVARNGKPLGAEEARKEQAKMDKLAAERARESEAARKHRLAEYGERRRKQRAFLQEIPKAYTLQMAGETTLGGRAAWIIDATPVAGYEPKETRAKMLTKFKGRFYVSKQDMRLIKLEAEAIDSVSFGLVLAKLERGARFTMEKTKVNNELWMPLQIKVDFDARLALLKRIKVDLRIDYSNFRKFQSESRIVSVGGEDR